MVGVMSYHYPAFPSEGDEMGMPPPPNFMPSYTIPSQQLTSLPTVDQQAPPLLSQQHGMEMKGTYPAPGAGPLHSSETDEQQQQSGSAGEKKRNKLGYHRTSVACGKLESIVVRYLYINPSFKVTAGVERLDASLLPTTLKDAVSTVFG